ncbi:ankyrin repeat protein, putative [Trichomonas vaginalis G3]|uniref:Ankyrin repeat protein, putative n=1 Tax=Trichomonas vaginalis (strain ATCC PRA-98 / G3) TaxID=412133 RepID=A2E4Q4_TRIV3|nr:ankyrin repeat and SOCS box-containing protein 4 family [Trichomonas vaginalis G3]EAY12364.1 ankyrin repeat protein, putative [Trichomonas vaginalis G3]KAI5500782.1 ankyrin repeat and SOCS box-containing protein 4 family [Trichomonas vaginalis G3]|eukprot:XP_001324587.1 ankyrin repeat protein [Trichomonas vaginalis G3]
MINTNLIDSKNHLPETIIKDIIDIIPYNNRYTKSYLSLAKLISDNYQVKEVNTVIHISNFLFYKEYGIKLDKYDNFEKDNFKNLDIHTENTIYRAIMNNDLEIFISFTEREGFDKYQILQSNLYPYTKEGYSLLELCCYHGAVDCFKFLRTKFNSRITEICLQFSFLGGNQEIMSECLKNKKPDKKCMEYAIISHNIDFVTFLVNEYDLEIDLEYCRKYKNLESFLVVLDQSKFLINSFILSPMFNIPSICQYFLSHGVDINETDDYQRTALHSAVEYNSKETAEFLISHGANINKKDKDRQTALHYAAIFNRKETAELLISHGANINEKDKCKKTALHSAAEYNSKEIAALLISHGANINENDKFRKTALHYAAEKNTKEIAELLISHDANINKKDKCKKTALHYAVENKSKEIVELLISHGANINEKDEKMKTALHYAAEKNSKETAELLISHGAYINEEDNYGETALEIARDHVCTDTAKLLLSFGAKDKQMFI